MSSNFTKILIVFGIVILIAIIVFCFTVDPSELPTFLLKWIYT